MRALNLSLKSMIKWYITFKMSADRIEHTAILDIESINTIRFCYSKKMDAHFGNIYGMAV